MLQWSRNNPAMAGILVGILSALPHFLLPHDQSVGFAALTLVFIAGIYVGFAIVHGHEAAFGVETLTALLFTAIAMLGLYVWPWAIPLGLVGHGLWDLAHHRPLPYFTALPKWYPAFCLAIDFVLAAILLALWLF